MKRFIIINKPNIKLNKNRTNRPWLVKIYEPSDLYNNHAIDEIDSEMWYVPDEDEWCLNKEFKNRHVTNLYYSVYTIKALKRKIRKWKLPINSIVTATDITLTYTYKFLIK